MAIVDRKGPPTAITAFPNEYHEVKLVQMTLDFSVAEVSPERIISDAAYDSDNLDKELAQAGIEMITLHKKNRKKRHTQDSRSLKRMKRHFTVKQTFAWLK